MSNLMQGIIGIAVTFIIFSVGGAILWAILRAIFFIILLMYGAVKKLLASIFGNIMRGLRNLANIIRPTR